MLLAQLLNQEQTQDAWHVFLNVGIAGIIAFMVLMFMGLVLWTLWLISKKLIAKYLPEFIEEVIKTIRSVRESQTGIVETQRLHGENLVKLVDLSAQNQRRDEELGSVLKAKMDPFGKNYKDHAFSASRVEEFLLLSLNMIEEYLNREADPTIRVEWRKHLEAMRRSLQHPKS
jgi:hypothetical protein